MIQRKCGTCKYFEEGGIASSGWCRHPERQELEHMVLVRKTELACRNGWDDDLWEPRDGYTGANPDTSNSTSRSRPSSATVTGRNGQRTDEVPDRGRDTVVAPAQPATDPSPPVYGAQTQTPPVRRNGEAPRRRMSESALDAWSSAFTPDRPQASTEVDEFQGESIAPPVKNREADWHEHAARLSQLETSDNGSVPVRPSFPEGQGQGKQTDRGSDEPWDELDDRPSVDDHPKVQQSGVTEQFDVEPDDARAPQDMSAVQEIEYGPSEGDEVPDIVDEDRAGEPPRLPMAGQTKACCRNCRDFLPSDGGRRGWCNNPFAFSKRREVSGDSLACQSTVGSWWSPSDDWWMERADIAHHSAPTPLVDNLIRQIRSRELEARGSTEERERS